jgi:hypothetical protein
MRGDRIDNEDALQRVRIVLNQSTESLPEEVVIALRSSRIKAVELAEKRERSLLGFVPRWVTASGVATLAILVVAVSLWLSPLRTPPLVSPDDELEVVASGEQLELYEDLEFFIWLAERDRGR